MSGPAQAFARYFPNRMATGRFLRRILAGLAAAGVLVWLAMRAEDINWRREIAVNRATGLSAIAGRSNYLGLVSEGKLMSSAIPQAVQNTEKSRIAHTASIRISVRDFSGARETVVRIVSARGGYVKELTLSSPKDSTRSLVATLEIPAAQGDAALEELRKLGRVEEERQESEEVTARSEDLEIRLRNTRETETRLTSILRAGAAKLSDILDVETEITRVRGEIEGMEAEQKRLNGRVQFSTIDLNLSEDFQARPELASGQEALRLKNAIIEGYQNALSGLFGALEIILAAVPSLLSWGLILFWPLRWAWRRWRNGRAEGAPVPQV